MNKYVRQFLHRGLIFGGFGPIIAGVVFFFIDVSGVSLDLSGGEMFLAIFSIYLLAFVQAGASVFNQIEDWPIAKSLGCHLGALYLVYLACYLVNSWIPFEPMVLLIFTAIFLAVYFAVWFTVFVCTKAASRKMSEKLKPTERIH